MPAAMPQLPPASKQTATEALAPLVNIIICFIILNTIFLILRFFTVLYLRPKKLGLSWDDWLLIPAYVFTLGVCINILVIANYLSGKAPANYPMMDPNLGIKTAQAVFAMQEILTPAYAFTRFSILALYLRVFTGKWIRAGSWFMVAIIAAQWIAFGIATIFQCIPVDYFWNRIMDPTGKNGSCFNITKFYRSFTPANIAADVIIFFMPFATIWQLDMGRMRKGGVTVLLAMGSVALAASIVRAVVMDTNDATAVQPDILSRVLRWPVIETSLFFITSCLPTMAPLCRVLVPRALRNKLDDKVTQHRHSMNPRFRTGAGTTGGKADHRLSFTRLVDDGMFGRSGSSPMTGMTSRADGRKMSLSDVEQSNSVPLQHIKQVTQGHGIMVTHEVTVTQEERVETVFGI